MKKIIALSAVALLSTSIYADADMQAQLDALKAQLEKLETQYTTKIKSLESQLAKTEKKQKRLTKKVSAVNKLANNDNIKFDVDFRTAYDNLQYKTSDGTKYSNDGLYSMRLWLGMGYAPTDDMMFKGTLAYNKAFGANYGQMGTGQGFDTFDWIVNENLTNDTLRVKEAYWFWSPTINDRGYTLSVGRRPATNGFLVNMREDDKAKSPIGHIINMEFDGISGSVKTDDIVEGSYLKVCLGRGLSEANGRFNMANPDYAEDGGLLHNMDLVGVIAKMYDDGQYTAFAKYYRAFNVLGMDASTNNLKTYGDVDGAALSFQMSGVGDEINDFLDDTTLFASFAWSNTRPQDGKAMLGSLDNESGSSIYLGAQMPNMTGGKFGLEYNHGSKYWRPFTYGEDTMIGSKLAVRGDAYEAYWTQPIIDKIFTMQVRYTYIDYDYTGSQAFFGDFGTPMDVANIPSAIDTAQDLRVYFRYRY
ncbi:MAG: DUF3373 family protein [Campylobacterales bacterium]